MFVCLYYCSLVVKGYRTPLQAEDLWHLREEDTSHKILSDLEEEWSTERTKLQQYVTCNLLSRLYSSTYSVLIEIFKQLRVRVSVQCLFMLIQHTSFISYLCFTLYQK